MRKYRRVTREDRCHLKACLDDRMTLAEIAQRLNFHKSTVSREIKRNRSGEFYRAHSANRYSILRFRSCRRKIKLIGTSAELVIEKLKCGWSPEQISGRFSRERKLAISHEAIYRFIRADKAKGGSLFKLLRRPVKRAQSRYYVRFKQCAELLNIREREAVANRRERIGDWERDTMYGANGKFLLVLVDRKTKYILMGKPQGRKSSEIGEITNALLQNKPLLSITNDNGSEFKDHYMFKCPVYYCDPHKPQQRGTVENTVGLVRQYVSRQTDLTKLSEQEVRNIEMKLNNRPRKCLDYKTPDEVWSEETVALAI